MGRTSLKYDILGGLKTHLKEYTGMLFKGDPDAEKFFEDQKALFEGAYDLNLITLDQKNNAIDSFLYVQEGATDVFKQANDGNALSFDYNKGSHYSGEAPSSRPSVAAVSRFSLDFEKEANYSQAVKDMINGKEDALAYVNMSPNDREMYKAANQGYQRGIALVQSNMPLVLINERIAKLSNASSAAMTEDERVELETLKLAKNEINDNFLGFMAKTGEGARIVEKTQNEMNGINNSLMPADEKENQKATLFNNSLDAMVGLAKTQGFSANQIKIAPVADVQQVSGAFAQGANPTGVLDTVRKYSKQNIGWLANSIKNSRQAELVQAIGYTQDKINSSNEPFLNRMIMANQDNVSFGALNQTKEAGTEIHR